jgi:type I restriction enzyme S subunit
MSARHTSLADVCSVVGGGTPAKSIAEYYGGSIPWVTPKDMKTWEIEGSQINITDAGLKNSAARLVPRNSVLVVVRSGVLKHTVPVAINRVPVAINQDMKALLCSDSADPDYVARFVKARSPVILQWVRATTADNFPIDKLKRLEIPLPPLPEQRRIAEILDKADALRAKRRAALAQLDTLTQSIFLEMFGDPAAILDRWPTKKLGELLDFLTSGSRGWAKHYADAGDLFLRIQNVRQDELLLDDVAYVNAPDTAEARRTHVKPGDVLLSITADLGRTAVVPDELGPAFINQHLAILRTKAVAPRFLSAYLTSPTGRRHLLGRNKQGVKAGLNFDDIRSFIVPTPPAQLQKDFVCRVVASEKLKSGHESSRANLDALFASLQHRGFRGDL